MRCPAGNLPRAGTGEPLLEAEEDQGTGLRSDSIPLSMFSCPGAAGFKVRGPNYLQDKKKVALFRLRHACSAASSKNSSHAVGWCADCVHRSGWSLSQRAYAPLHA